MLLFTTKTWPIHHQTTTKPWPKHVFVHDQNTTKLWPNHDQSITKVFFIHNKNTTKTQPNHDQTSTKPWPKYWYNWGGNLTAVSPCIFMGNLLSNHWSSWDCVSLYLKLLENCHRCFMTVYQKTLLSPNDLVTPSVSQSCQVVWSTGQLRSHSKIVSEVTNSMFN